MAIQHSDISGTYRSKIPHAKPNELLPFKTKEILVVLESSWNDKSST